MEMSKYTFFVTAVGLWEGAAAMHLTGANALPAAALFTRTLLRSIERCTCIVHCHQCRLHKRQDGVEHTTESERWQTCVLSMVVGQQQQLVEQYCRGPHIPDHGVSGITAERDICFLIRKRSICI
jgi:hypothetical protein